MITNPSPHLFWITSRAAGFTALIVASLAVSIGLLMSTKLIKGRVSDLRVAHEVLSLSALVAIVVHGVTLIGDRYMHPSVLDITEGTVKLHVSSILGKLEVVDRTEAVTVALRRGLIRLDR